MISVDLPLVRTLLVAYLNRTTGESSEAARIEEFALKNSADVVNDAIQELRTLLDLPVVPVGEVVRLANRHMETEDEVRQWLSSVLADLEQLRAQRSE